MGTAERIAAGGVALGVQVGGINLKWTPLHTQGAGIPACPARDITMTTSNAAASSLPLQSPV